jgi:prephenate dehydrogenase
MTHAPQDPRTREFAAAQLPDRIAFLGLGLIGGSVAMALREAGYRGALAAWTPSGRGPAEARRRGIVDDAAATVDAALEGAGLVILAGPPLAVLDAVGGTGDVALGGLPDAVTVTDVASTKARIVDVGANQRQIHFVGGHPMAGRETTGVEAATADLFVDRPWVVVPGADPRGTDIDLVWSLARATGATPMLLGPKEHDAAVAAISHLPLVLAAALVESVAGTAPASREWSLARALSATGWRDMSRLAKGDPEMGAGILATNAEAVRERLQALRATLDEWIAELDGRSPDPAPLRGRLQRARAALDPDGTTAP